MFEFLISPQNVRPLYLISPIFLYYFIEYIRRLRKYYYSPVYFPFVFESLNPKFAAFYGTNIIYGSEDLSENDLTGLEKSIRLNAIISALISGFIIPFSIGYASGAVLSAPEFILAAFIIGGIRLYEILRAIVDYNSRGTGFKNKRGVILLIMIIYIISVLYFMLKGFDSGKVAYKDGGLSAFMLVFLDSIIFNFLWQGLIFPTASGLMFKYFIDYRLRKEMLEGD